MQCKIAVLTPEVSKESAEVLATALNADLIFPYVTEERDFTKYDYVFKYGFSKKIKAKKGATFNKTENINIARDKIQTFVTLKDENITVPMTLNKEQAVQWIKDGHNAVAREFSKEANGKGITYCTTIKELNTAPAIFWTKQIHEVQELRVYLWRNKVLSIYIKDIGDGNFIFKLNKGQEEHPQLVNMANKVYEKVGLDFCGLDVLTDVDGTLLLLEVNSAPILFPYTCKKLVSQIKQEIVK